MTTPDTVRIYCDRKPEHEQRGRRWIETFAPSDDSALGSWGWRPIPPERGRARGRDTEALHPTSEVWITADGPVRMGTTALRGIPVGDHPVPGRRFTREGDVISYHPIDSATGAELEDVGEVVRVVYQLRCRTCGLSPEVRKERLDPFLDQLASGGAREVSLENVSRFIG